MSRYSASSASSASSSGFIMFSCFLLRPILLVNYLLQSFPFSESNCPGAYKMARALKDFSCFLAISSFIISHHPVVQHIVTPLESVVDSQRSCAQSREK